MPSLLILWHSVQGLVAHVRLLPLLVVQPQDLRVELPDDKHQLWDPRRAEEVPAGDLRVWKSDYHKCGPPETTIYFNRLITTRAPVLIRHIVDYTVRGRGQII